VPHVFSASGRERQVENVSRGSFKYVRLLADLIDAHRSTIDMAFPRLSL